MLYLLLISMVFVSYFHFPYFWYTNPISTFISHIRPLLRGFSSTTTTWSLFFLVVIGCFTTPFLGDGSLFSAYKKYATWGIGGPSESLSSELGAVSVAQASYGEGEQNNKELFTPLDEGAFFGVSPSLIDALPIRDGIKKYKMKKGDTFSSIAAQFGITLETLRASNTNVKKIRIGQELIILPTSGVPYTTQQGDTLQGIADRFKIDADVVKKYNPEYTKLIGVLGGTLVLPSVKEDVSQLVIKKETGTENLADLAGYFALPAKGWNWGKLHEYNAVDIANTCGSSIYAAADGVVIEESSDGSWNGGYGNYVLVEHPNKTQTRYAHTLKNIVKVGDVVSQGKNVAFIGSSGNTQGATGCHLHFEVLGAKNPFALK